MNSNEDVSVSNLNDESKELIDEISNKNKLEACEITKKEGNLFFKNEEYEKAIQCYEKSLKYIPLLFNKEEEEKEKDIEEITKNIKIQCYSNILMCKIKQKKYKEGIEFADKILNLDSKNIKGYYRKGFCFEKIKEFELAEEFYLKVFNFEKTDHIKNKLNDLKKLKKKEFDKEKKVYKNILDKMNLYPEKNEIKKSKSKYWIYFSFVFLFFILIFKLIKNKNNIFY